MKFFANKKTPKILLVVLCITALGTVSFTKIAYRSTKRLFFLTKDIDAPHITGKNIILFNDLSVTANHSYVITINGAVSIALPADPLATCDLKKQFTPSVNFSLALIEPHANPNILSTTNVLLEQTGSFKWKKQQKTSEEQFQFQQQFTVTPTSTPERVLQLAIQNTSSLSCIPSQTMPLKVVISKNTTLELIEF